MVRPSPSERRGATRPALLLFALAVAVLAWVAWDRGGAPPPAVDGPPTRTVAAPDTPAVDLPLERTARASDAAGGAAWSTHDIDVRPGVRLAGDGRLAGRVVERAGGAGVAGLRVDLLPNTPVATEILRSVLSLARASAGLDQRSLPVAVARTADDGSFAFEGVRAGVYFLDARGAHHVADELLRVEVAPSGAGGPVVFHVRAGGRVLGTVSRPDGSAAAGARVSVAHGPRSVLRAFRAGEMRRLDATCDDDGAFVLAGVTPGQGYQLHAIGAGFALTHEDLPEVRAGEDLAVEIVGRRGATLSGRVLGRAAGNDDAEAVPLAGAQVAVLPQGLRDMAYLREVLAATTASTDADGAWSIRHAPPGVVQVLAVAPGWVPGESRRLEVADGAALVAPDVVLSGGPVLHGRVVDSGGAGILGVHVRWFTGRVERVESWDFGFAPLLHQAVGDFSFPASDAEGRFDAGPLPGEPPYLLYLAKPGYPYTRVRWDPEQDGPEKEFTLTGGASVAGRIVDGESGAPVTRFRVASADRIDRDFRAPSAWNPFSGELTFEDQDGAFLVRDVVTPSAELEFRADGHHPARRTFALREGEALVDQVVELVAGGTVTGQVVDQRGEPVAGAQVSLLEGGGWSVMRTFDRLRDHRGRGAYADTPAEGVSNAVLSFATGAGFLGASAVTTDADGAFRLEGAAPGRYAVVARQRDYALATSAPFTIAEGQDVAGLAVTMTRGATLWGRVTDRFDRPVTDAILVASSPAEYSGDQSAEAAAYQGATDAEGWYSIEHLAGGSYSLSLVHDDDALDPIGLAARFQFDLVVVPPGERVRKDLVDLSAAACRVHGIVTAEGRPLAGGGVLALSFGAENAVGLDAKASRIDHAGRYAFPGLMPGPYQLVVQSAGGELRLFVDVPDAPDLQLDLTLPTGGVRGRVVSHVDGRPVARAEVTLVPEDQPDLDPFVSMLIYQDGANERVVTDADGAFAFEGYQAGLYALRAEGPRGGGFGRPGPVAVEVGEGRITDGVVVELPAPLAIEGRVADHEGRPVARALVAAVASDGRSQGRRARSDDQGAFRIDGLAPGEFRLVASAEGYADARSEALSLDEPGRDGVELTLTPGTLLSLLVLDPDGEPVAGAVASVFDDRGYLLSRGAPDRANVLAFFAGRGGSDEDGLLELGRYAPGAYRIEVWRGGVRERLDDVAVVTGPPQRVTAVLPR